MAIFLRSAFLASRVHYISETKRGKKEGKKHDENIMSASATQGGHN